MPNVQMPDGAIVAMPDKPDPILTARLKTAYDGQSFAAAQGHTPGTPAWDSTVRAFAPRSAERGQPAQQQPDDTMIPDVNGATQPLGHILSRVLNAPDELGAHMADTYLDPKGAAPTADEAQSLQEATPTQMGGLGGTSPAIATALRLAPTVASLGMGAASDAVNGVRAAQSGEAAPVLTSAQRAGFRSQHEHPFSASIAGSSGQDALTLHNNAIADRIGSNEANVAPGADLGYDSLEQGREGPGSVYNRMTTEIGDGHNLSADPTIQSAVENATGPRRITKGTPDAEAKIAALRSQILDGKPRSGDEIITEMRGLRQEGSTNLGSDDVSNQQLGRAQINIAHALEDYAGDALPPDAPVSKEQFQAARQSIAKNYAVQGALRGNTLDPQAIARLQRHDPAVLTDGLKTIGDFANENPTVTGLASRIYQKPNYASDILGGGAYQMGRNAESFMGPIAGAAGLKALARRVLTGNTGKAVDAAGEAFPSLGDAFAPLPSKLHLTPPEGTVSQEPHQPLLGDMSQGPGPNPDLRLTQPPGTVFEPHQLGANFEPHGLPPFQQPGAAGLPSPAGPQGAIDLPGGEAPAAAQGALPFGPPLGERLSGGDAPAAPNAPGKGPTPVYRGVQPGMDPTAPQNPQGATFHTPDKSEAEAYGPIVHEHTPTDVHDAGSIHDFFTDNGVDPKQAGQTHALMEAIGNYKTRPDAKSWLKFSYPLKGNPTEYVHLSDLEKPTLADNFAAQEQ